MRIPHPCAHPGPRLARTCVLLAAALVAGCGSNGSATTHASAAVSEDATGGAGASCQATVLDTLTNGVLVRIYHEGIHSERTIVAQKLVEGDRALAAAVAAGDAAGAQQAAQRLLATGKLTNLVIVAGGRRLVDLGPPAITPLHGVIRAPSGAVAGTYVTSVWSDEGFKDEGMGVAQGSIAIRRGTRSVGGTFAMGRGVLPGQGELRVGPTAYVYSSFPAEAFPAGRARIYLIKTAAQTARLCGSTHTETVMNTLRNVAQLIYGGEGGNRAQVEVRRVQSDPALLQAVAARNPVAARAAIESLLNHHIVRLRVSAGRSPLADIGAKDALAPVAGTLRLGGHRIGSLMLSIQDDEGYKRLLERLVGLRVIMSIGAEVVKNSLGPLPAGQLPPTSGAYEYKGQGYEVFTLHFAGVPTAHRTTTASVPLTVRVLVPMPYT